jgi:PKD repeat protein
MPDTGFSDCVSDGDLQAELQARLAALALPIDDAHLYMVFFPQHVQTCERAGSTGLKTPCSTNVYCAYHGTHAASNILIYANEPFPDPNKCSGQQSPNGDAAADDQVSMVSHEANESITDAFGAWVDSTGAENGDQCAFVYGAPLGATGAAGTSYNQVIGTGHYYTQDEFSNADLNLSLGDTPTGGMGETAVKGCIQNEELPTASFTAAGTAPACTFVGFDGSASSDADGNLTLTYSWNWGDGSPNSTGASVPHMFASAGSYNVTLTVTDNDGWSASIMHAVIVTTGTTPGVSGIAPKFGPAAGGTSVVIAGACFTGVTGVQFGSTPAATYNVDTASQITATSPAGSGIVDVTVTAGGVTTAATTLDKYTFFPGPGVPGVYTAVTPVRLLDTRSTGPLGPAGYVDLPIGGTHGVPGNATAVILNVTTVNGSTAGFFTVYPTGNPLPTASNLNWVAGETVPNLVSVGLGNAGSVTIYNGLGTAHAVVDLQGYFAPPGLTTAGEFLPLVPARIADTRGHGQLGPAQTADLQVTGAGAIPTDGVSAVVMNVTAVDESTAGFVTVFPAGAPLPLASNLNWTAGVTVPNRVIVQVGVGGKVSFYNGLGYADLVIDVNGYFTDSTRSGAAFIPVVPSRIMDTRTSSPLGPAGTNTLLVAGNGGVPAVGGPLVITGAVLNVTATAPSTASDLVIWRSDASMPNASDLNFVAGQTVPNLVVVLPSPTGAIDIFNPFGTVHVVVDVVGWFGSP